MNRKFGMLGALALGLTVAACGADEQPEDEVIVVEETETPVTDEVEEIEDAE